jgi:outer membrane protein OmpA-like peptidoglycan-associated protein
MFGITSLRRALGVAVAGALAATGLTLALPVSAAHAGLAPCQVAFSASIIRPGENVTITATGDPHNYPAIFTADGALLLGRDHQSGLPVPYTSSWPYSYLRAQAGSEASSVGIRLYDADTVLDDVRDEDPSLCSANIDFGPALQAQTITFPAVPDTLLSAGSVAMAASSDSELPITYSSSTPAVCTTTGGSQVTLVTNGFCTIVASQDGLVDGEPGYDAATQTQSFWVQAPQNLLFPAISDQLLSKGSITLEATSNSDTWIDYQVADSSVCSVPVVARRPAGAVRPAMSIDLNVLTFHKLGTCTVSAQQYGYGEWLASAKITRSFQIVEAKPALSLTVPTGVALSKGTAPFTATSSMAVQNVLRASRSAAKVVTTSSTPSVCKVASVSSVKLVKAGTCTLTAAQSGVGMVTKSFPVWGAPVIPAKGKTTQTVPVLGRGESDLKVNAKPAGVCRATSDGAVTLIAPGTCKITVTDPSNKATTKVRSGSVKIAFVKSAKPSQQLKHAGKVLFAFDSAVLTPAAKKALRHRLATLREATTVIVYGNTYGPGKNSDHSRQLADDRAAAVVDYLKAHGVKAKAVTVAAAMQNPVSKDPAKNRRADIYYIK